MKDRLELHGTYYVECWDPSGKLKWMHRADNTVTIAGKNAMLDAALSGSGYTVNGPFMSLISGSSYTGISSLDTMTSHAGWHEAGGAYAPQYSGSRTACAFLAATGGVISLTGQISFTMSATGVVKGVFLVYGAGAQATKDDTGGVLFSAGRFASGDASVNSGDIVKVSYSLVS